jgi:DNA-binding response OmpR family regulator
VADVLGVAAFRRAGVLVRLVLRLGVARALRRDLGDSKTLIIAVSGYGSREDLQRAVEAGFDADFVKPMEIAELQAFVVSRLHA